MRNHLLNRVEALDYLIRSRSTGTPAELAARFSMSERSIYDILDFMRYLGAPICYSRSRRTYYYSEKGSLSLRFQKAVQDSSEFNTQDDA